MSYGRMKEKQQQLKEEVKQLLERAEAADEAEDRQYGSQRGDELPDQFDPGRNLFPWAKRGHSALQPQENLC
jgi:hypothetical protein